MTRIAHVAAFFLALAAVSCAGVESPGAERLANNSTSPQYATAKPPAMDDKRKVLEQDCSKPIQFYEGNLRCK